MIFDDSSQTVFLSLAFLALLLAKLVVLSPKAIYSALSLVGVFIILSVFYLWMGQEYFSAMQLLIYVGAIMILFVFMVMLLNTKDDKEIISLNWRNFVVFIMTTAFAGILGYFALTFQSSAPKFGNYSTETIKQVGSSNLFSEQLFLKSSVMIIAVAILLLAGVLGAVMLTKKDYTDDTP